MMQALCADAVGDWRTVLQWKEVDRPLPHNSSATLKEHDVLIRVAYCDLNPVDLQKIGQKRADDGAAVYIPGFSGSGVVVRVGTGVVDTRSITEGARVAFLTAAGGAYAEEIVVDARAVAVIPHSVSLLQACVVPLAGCTAYESLVKLGLGPSAAAARRGSNSGGRAGQGTRVQADWRSRA